MLNCFVFCLDFDFTQTELIPKIQQNPNGEGSAGHIVSSLLLLRTALSLFRNTKKWVTQKSSVIQWIQTFKTDPFFPASNHPHGRRGWPSSSSLEGGGGRHQEEAATAVLPWLPAEPGRLSQQNPQELPVLHLRNNLKIIFSNNCLIFYANAGCGVWTSSMSNTVCVQK